jgi:ubiquinol-cytochrome c reductase cytochrome b subunit
MGFLASLPLIDKRADRGVPRRIQVLLPVGLIGLGALALTLKSFRLDAADADLAKAVAKAVARADRARSLSEEGVPPEGALAMMRNDPTTRRVSLFEQHCASCHRMGDLAPADGKDTAPDLTGFGSAAWATKVLEDPDHDRMFGKTSFKGMMPSVTKPPADPEAAKVFTPMAAADMTVIVGFLEAEARGDKTAGTQGEKLVRQRCTSCHRLDGKTDDEDSLAPELRGWGSNAWIQAQIDDPGSGKTYPPAAMDPKLEGHMPAFKDKLPDADRKLLTAFVAEQRARKR